MRVAKKNGSRGRLTQPIQQSRAVPIGDYGFLSDGEVSALVAPGGSVDWMCVPRFDSPSVVRRDPGPPRRRLPGRAARDARCRPTAATCPAR